MAYIPHVYYAPNYKWEAGKLVLKEGKVAGTDEYIEGKAEITPNGQGINVSFADATRNYSRLRIATMPNISITVSINRYIPAGSSEMEWFQDIALTSDEKGNAYLYGTFGNNFNFSVKYGGAILATHTIEAAKTLRVMHWMLLLFRWLTKVSLTIKLWKTSRRIWTQARLTSISFLLPMRMKIHWMQYITDFKMQGMGV